MTDSHRKGARKTEHSKQGGGKRGDVVERTARAAEKVHRAIARLPLDLLGLVERLEKPVARVRKLQDRSITASYAMLRGIGREVADLARGTRIQPRMHQKPRGARAARAVTRPHAASTAGAAS